MLEKEGISMSELESIQLVLVKMEELQKKIWFRLFTKLEILQQQLRLLLQLITAPAAAPAPAQAKPVPAHKKANVSN